MHDEEKPNPFTVDIRGTDNIEDIFKDSRERSKEIKDYIATELALFRADMIDYTELLYRCTKNAKNSRELYSIIYGIMKVIEYTRQKP